MSYAIPTNTLIANGKLIRITGWGTKTGAANNPDFEVYANGSTITTGTFNLRADSDSWICRVTIMRLASNTQNIYTYLLSTDVGGIDGGIAASFGEYDVQRAATTLTDSNAITISFRITASLATDTVTQEGMLIELLN